MMKKLFFTTVATAFSLLALNAQPRALFVKIDHDFGNIKEIDGVVSTEYTVRNVGNQPLLLTEVKPSCGCTQPTWSNDTIPAGGEGWVRATFDPKNLPGPFEKVVYVRTNGIPNSITLLFRGNVEPRPFEPFEKYPIEFGKLRIDNNYLTFGQAYSGEIDSAEFKVYNQSKEDIYITNVVNVPSYVNFEIPSLRIKPNEESIIKAKFNTKASQKWGEKNMVFYMNTSDSIASSEIPIYAQIHILEKFPKMTKKQLEKAPKVQVDAQHLYLGKILKGDSVKFQYTVTNMGKEALIIRSVNTVCGCTTSEIEKTKLKRGESTIVRGTFYSEGRDGMQDKFIYIVTNDPVTPELRLGFSTEIVTNPNALKY